MAKNRQTILDLETRFWQSVKDKDTKAAKAMLADKGLVAGPKGAMKMDPASYEKRARESTMTLKSFELSDADVVFPNEDTALIAYNIHLTGVMNGKPTDIRCVDTSGWMRDGNDWKCSLHTETMLENR